MKYRIRYYLTLAALTASILGYIPYGNAMERAGMKAMMQSYENNPTLTTIKDTRRMLCQLPVGGAVCVPRLPVRKPV